MQHRRKLVTITKYQRGLGKKEGRRVTEDQSKCIVVSLAVCDDDKKGPAVIARKWNFAEMKVKFLEKKILISFFRKKQFKISKK